MNGKAGNDSHLKAGDLLRAVANNHADTEDQLTKAYQIIDFLLFEVERMRSVRNYNFDAAMRLRAELDGRQT